jgi:hypothetical protein
MNGVQCQAMINDVKDEAHYKTDKLVPVSEEEKIDIRYIINFII